MDQSKDNQNNNTNNKSSSTVVLINEEATEDNGDDEYFYDEGFFGFLKECLKLEKPSKIGNETEALMNEPSKTRSKRLSNDQALYEFLKNPKHIMHKSQTEIEDIIDVYINRGSDLNFKAKFENTILLRVTI